MLNTVKKILGIGCALFGSTILVLSLVGAIGPGCGGKDDCEAACDNVRSKCGSFSSSSSGASCASECRSDLNSSSMSASEKRETRTLLKCMAEASSCSAIATCVMGGGSSTSVEDN